MRKIPLLILMFLICAQMAVADTTPRITRIILSASDNINYESTFKDNPSRLILRFNSKNVFGNIVDILAAATQRPIKDIKVVYYPVEAGAPRNRIKFLTFYLEDNTGYKIRDNGREIFLDFKNPSDVKLKISNPKGLKEISIDAGTVNAILSQFEITKRPSPNPNKDVMTDILLMTTVLLIAIYALWIKPGEWKGLFDKIATNNWPFLNVSIQNMGHERRRWWRHNLTLLKNKNIYAKLISLKSNTKLQLTPRDLGYGGLCIECNSSKRLDGELDINLFMPDRAFPIPLKGRIAWQKRLFWNPWRKLIGISFIDPPQKEWASVHRYLEAQYAALKS